jgi:hypothetical protein
MRKNRIVSGVAMLLFILAIWGAHGQGWCQAPELGARFDGGGISFAYPKDWQPWEKESLDKIAQAMKSKGVELPGILASQDKTRIIQVLKQKNESTPEALFKEKKEVADQLNAGKSGQGDDRVVKSTASLVDLVPNQKAVMFSAEKQNGEVGISYQILSGGHLYAVSFLYKTPDLAAKDEKLRAEVVKTIKIGKP